MPIDGITSAIGGGLDWSVAAPGSSPIGPAIENDGTSKIDGADGASGGGFGSMLSQQLGNLKDLQTDAAAQSQALATGQATDASAVVMAVEKAQLSMQLAATLRDKSVESFQEVFRTQV
ncbi:MAG TPA: flagellar hook-basal body complex protein FliE [Solirubrobacteraceae bacterium]|nr:flagellar hook-basal body complex protein FliE [Solirubrobacteraceae bacterium]